jgi:hypothetical protein
MTKKAWGKEELEGKLKTGISNIHDDVVAHYKLGLGYSQGQGVAQSYVVFQLFKLFSRKDSILLPLIF